MGDRNPGPVVAMETWRRTDRSVKQSVKSTWRMVSEQKAKACNSWCRRGPKRNWPSSASPSARQLLFT